ncbi:ImmA/IrrE family metallo-endopeptidase [Microbacterium sp.]|uniref:ImmA/IrrE family metallo-endopeptidase n=1 Tax=Microbacterium sp. TaxID=51671 RepID=UPI002811A17B|nr:ImmA/IrrE family metallo-endopeptidase [Microbacterium sp.]
MQRTMQRLLDMANALGYAVYFCGLRGDLLACTVPALMRIFIDSRLTDSEQQGHLAHELGHVYHDHPCIRHPQTANEHAIERQADRFAARVLIDPIRYAELESVNPDQHYLADELGVPIEYVHVYEAHCLTRVRGVTYTHAREGVGQWAHRVEVA